eukprot:PITA_17747
MMDIVSMNIRGLGSGPKYLALKHIFLSARPKIILIQESMDDRHTSLTYFRKMFPSWHMAAIDACGHSGGLIALWNPLWIRTSAYKCFASILLNVSFRGIRSPINILNIYAPYSHRYSFWDRFFTSDLCEIHHLLLVGDMNFTLGSDEVWGGGRHMDPLSDFLKARFLQWNFIDIAPSILTHTWDNGRTGDSYIAKRLDRAIIQANVIDQMGMPFLSIGNESISDHWPIFIQWRQRPFSQHFPFKFDRTFIEDPVFILMVTTAWRDSAITDSSCAPSFHTRMKFIRSIVKSWQTANKKNNRVELQHIQCDLDHIHTAHDPNTMSFNIRRQIAELTRRKLQLLKMEESSWHLKSRALWLRLGDRNTKFFHRYANHRREINAIWRISDGNGGFLYSQQDITNAALAHFKSQYSRGNGCAIHDILWGIEIFPTMFNDKSNDSIYQPITEEELHGILKAFNKDKCPGPDGWTIEFFLCFFDILKQDLMHMIEESRTTGRIHPHTSSTYIALIPKKRDADTFLDFRPISLCNISFKIISKIIAERIKGILVIHLSKDQHAFLKGRNILDAVASTQECIYSIFTKNIDGAILKIDLQKAYDCIDWGFIRCLLARIGLREEMIFWIMACIEGVNYAININGIPSPFFTAERGLRQGCPLSPIIFILAMSTPSLHINKAVDEQRCTPIRISKHIFLSHNLFVDDILLCAMLQRLSWQCLFDIISNFQKAIGLIINRHKSILYYNGDNTALITCIVDMFGVQTQSIRNGITYLGFQLKPLYLASDWEWLVQRYYNKISSWEFRTLSLASRATLTVAVLTHLSVYWAHLFYIPTCIIRRLNQITACYIWGGSTNQHKIHLTKMKDISIPKQQGGWGIKDLRLFGCALICRTLWRGIYGSSPWSNIIRQRYMKGKSINFWYRKGNIGANIFIGIDPIVCGLSDIILPRELITQLQHQGIFTWEKLIKDWQGSTPIWMESSDLNLQNILVGIWKSITDSLAGSGIHRHGTIEQLNWTVCGFKRPVSIRDIYSYLSINRIPYSLPSFPYIFWKAKCPPKYIHFAWLVFYNKNLSWENLRKRSCHGPSRCSLCGNEEETNLHMFIKCPATLQIWYVLATNFDFSLTDFDSISAVFIWWRRQNGNRHFLILIFLWTVWNWRNAIIFRDIHMPPFILLDSIMSTWHMTYGSN